MKPWSHKRRKWGHDVEAHRTYLLNMWFREGFGRSLASELNNIILYGDPEGRHEMDYDFTPCPVVAPMVVTDRVLKAMREITGATYTKHGWEVKRSEILLQGGQDVETG